MWSGLSRQCPIHRHKEVPKQRNMKSPLGQYVLGVHTARTRKFSAVSPVESDENVEIIERSSLAVHLRRLELRNVNWKCRSAESIECYETVCSQVATSATDR
jgi:hypothetical protein